MGRKSFILHVDSLLLVKEMTDDEAGKLLKAIIDYQIGEESELDRMTKFIFAPFKSQFERDEESYQKTVERNRNNGSKGGRPNNPEEPTGLIDKPKKPTGLSGLQEKPKKADNKNDSKNDSKSKNETSLSVFNDEAIKFSEWYLEKHHPSNIQVTEKIKKGWIDTYRKLREIDNKTKDEIKNATIYGRTNDFWKRQFLSPNKLRAKNKDDIMYIDVFLAQLAMPEADKTVIEKRIYQAPSLYPEAT